MNKFRIYDDEFQEYEHLVFKSLVEDFNVIDDRGPKFYTAESLVLQGSYILLADLNDDISPIESAKNLIEMKLENSSEFFNNCSSFKYEDFYVKESVMKKYYGEHRFANMSANRSNNILKNKNYIGLKQRYWRIDESGLNRIRKHSDNGMIIVSANKSGIFYSNENISLEDEYEEWLSKNNFDDSEKQRMLFLKERNRSADRQLEMEIKKHGYSFSRVFGGYKDLDNNTDSYEPSFIVYSTTKSGDLVDFDELEDFAIQMCKKFKQDSVYVQRPGETPVYIDMNGNQVNSDSSKKMKFNNDHEEFFTTTKRKKNNNKRFTSDIRFENFYTESASIMEIRKRSSYGEIFLMPHIGKIQQNRTNE